MDIPLYAILISIIVSGISAYFLYKDEIKKSNLWKVALFLRFLGTFLLVLLLFSPVITYQKNTTLKPKLLIYRDASLSCDSASSGKKFQLDSLLKLKFGESVELKYFKFSGDVYQENVTMLERDKQITRIDEVGSHFQQLSKDESVAAGILISDGIFNQGKLPGFIQNSSSLPLFVVGVGDTTQFPDLSVQSVIGNEFVYKQNKFVLETSLRCEKYPKGNVSVLIRENGNVIQKEVWIPNREIDWTKITFDISPSKLGWVQYSVEVKGNTAEKNSNNNIKNIWVQVVDEKKNIHLVYAKPHPDIKAIKLALESKVQNEISVYAGTSGIRNNGDVYVLHGYPSNKKELESVKNLLQLQKPMWLFAENAFAFDALGLALNQTLSFPFSQFQEVTSELSNSFGAFSLEQDVKKWKSFGAVQTPLTKLTLPSSFQIQLKQKWNGISTDFPLMGLVENQTQRSAWFFGTGVWRWRMNEQRIGGESVVFDDWLSKNMLWLAAAGQKQKELKISIQEREWIQGMNYPILVTHYDKAGLPSFAGNVKLYLIDSLSKKKEIALTKSVSFYKSNLLASQHGLVKLRAELSDKPEVFDEVIVNVSKLGIEAVNSVANFGQLKVLSTRFNGDFYQSNELIKLLSKLESMALKSERIVIQTVSLSFMQIFYVLVLIALLFSGDWFLRKWLGKI